MTHTHLTLDDVSYLLPDGRVLFSQLNMVFHPQRIALVGRNGVGKTVLARLLAGELQPSAGRCLRGGTAHYLAQRAGAPRGGTAAGLAGLQAPLDALARIEAGGVDARDFELLAERWDLRQRLEREWRRCGLGHLRPETPAGALSGGEAARAALSGAMLSDADFLILDEPSNHLDRDQRQALIEQLSRWPRGLLLISHDRQLLARMERIVELSPQGLTGYGGAYDFYAEQKAGEQARAQSLLEQRKQERLRGQRALREQQERQERRQARGDKRGREANQASILLDRQQQRSEASAGKLRRQQAAAREALDQAVREAARRAEDEAAVVVHALPQGRALPRVAVALDEVELPFAPPATRRVHLSLGGGRRIGVVGANGCGKSTLLKVLAGQLRPLAGRARVPAGCAYLAQDLDGLDPGRGAIEQLLAANPAAGESRLRMLLAQLGLDAGLAARPCGLLSGGERLKAALARALYADPPPPLLLLDEPSNHLDLPSLQALEAMLRNYRGGLLVVSHDDAFLDALGLDGWLTADENGWRLRDGAERDAGGIDKSSF
ncbi:ABC-F family ATP-binding cassette domain-containing protein [Chromobacterium alkanivorans]|uniref:ATP-binding cassette domain-containing protein n=1 Tax=Chromobacterium alkanivorans TaxID=1071719 RepID=UPI001967D30B|nr:ATP-binding cassette domain-containing protein [Chromobacterium alkanivorans]MBN3003478.1 ABC-F family ATP-binding cassette domain-containing protein [Chromobacterium alkanivorans]